MTFLFLANVDYEPGPGRGHLTDEGFQLQAGMQAQGWILCGTGYGDGCKDVKVLLDRHKPRAVFVSQKSDWDPKSGGAFRKDLGFLNLGELKQRKDIFKICPVKDASGPEYQRQFCEEIGADLVAHYYHMDSIGALCPWLKDYRTLRIYHSIDVETARLSFLPANERKRGVVSGAVSGVYPLREMVFNNAYSLGVDALTHPGYSNKGNASADYLKTIGGYKVSVATASKFGFALRKIFESVAVGATPITDLPDYDILPHIDKALIRIQKDRVDIHSVRIRIDFAASEWDYEERLEFAEACWKFYDWRRSGERLNAAIENVMDGA